MRLKLVSSDYFAIEVKSLASAVSLTLHGIKKRHFLLHSVAATDFTAKFLTSIQSLLVS